MLLTLDKVVCVQYNVGAEQDGTQQAKDGLLDRAWREEDLEEAPDHQRQ